MRTALDRCGRTINNIQELDSGWLVAGQPNPNVAGLVHVDDGLKFNFSPQKLDLSLEQRAGEVSLTEESLSKFASMAKILSAIVVEQLAIDSILRVGFRVWLMFGSSSIAEGEKWTRSLKVFEIATSLPKAFEAEMESVSLAVVLRGQDRRFRIGFNEIERSHEIDMGEQILRIRARDLPSKQREHLAKQHQIKKLQMQNPHFATLIDIDTYLDEPLRDVDPFDFIVGSFVPGLKCLGQSVEGASH